ncbi:hypothetical protein GCM10011376_24890 [Nocardioides flavus (ex Wang et al. 2016)]|uniref:Uncharacterized protein n=1 Tax=Nocardioides flavus (ex Wang et al. 2016) TaxID=2058780 RepID=A0ABQ3HP44_9ACTN|nr:hypothetical protein [Nocardioides flavus (ex Wang et al. 2016)]GHE17879.1 hypothetical protein GCM10011376_24890 [Nocardioides flavus (ex Wang et al. 2016)]
MRPPSLLAGLLAGALSASVGVVSGVAGTLLHLHWWGLALALATAVVVLGWLPPGGLRVAFALGWCVAVLRGVLEGPGGGFLVAADAAGWSLLAGSAVLLVASVATVRGRRTTPRGRADDPGLRGSAT